MSARVAPDTRARLVEAARASGNSVSEEIERRLSLSFDKDIVSNFGGPSNYALLRLTAEAIKQVEQVTGERWFNNRFTYDHAYEALTTILAAFRPPGKSHPPRSFPMIPALDARPDLKRAVRAAAAKEPVGKVAAETAIALMQAAPDTSEEEFAVYRAIATKLGKRLSKPVLPLPSTAEQETHNAQTTGRVPRRKWR